MLKVDRIRQLLRGCAIVVIVLMFGDVLLQIIARNFLETAPPWTEEVGRYLVVWLTAIGAGLHIGGRDGFRGAVEFVIEALPPKIRGLVNFSFAAVMAAFLALLATKSYQLFNKNLDVKSSALGLPLSYLYLALLVMAALMLWGLCHHLFRLLRDGGSGRGAALGSAHSATDGEWSARDMDRGEG